MAAISERVRDVTGEPLRLVLVLMQREIRDTVRDWRMVAPILILTLLFPALMSFVADMALDWVARYGAAIVGDRLMPFLLMVVGFFPISFSLVIALETFVGEKERNSLEPLLATPLSDAQLYLGKTLAAMVPPLLAAYIGIGVYLLGLYVFKGWGPPFELLVLVFALTSAEALVMVSGAVVVSSQTTSARAANLLASFIIIPVAFLMQGEAIIMFWANYGVLWWIVLFLVVVDASLIRMGIHLFNRESLLGRQIDELNVPYLWRTFWGHMRWRSWFFGLDPDALPPWLRWMGSALPLAIRCRPRSCSSIRYRLRVSPTFRLSTGSRLSPSGACWGTTYAPWWAPRCWPSSPSAPWRLRCSWHRWPSSSTSSCRRRTPDTARSFSSAPSCCPTPCSSCRPPLSPLPSPCAWAQSSCPPRRA
jgi:ABC-type transport system involved in multi-copper enzyme maturation permease subunit